MAFDSSAATALLAAMGVMDPGFALAQGATPPDAPSDNIYVANLPTEIDDETLKRVFSSYGVVTQCKAMPSSKGQGFAAAGLVRFASAEEAAWVVENVANTVPPGFSEPVVVKFAKGKGKGKDGGGYGKGQDDVWRPSPYGKGSWSGDAGKGGWGADPGKGSWNADAGKGSPWDGGYGPAAKGKGKGAGIGAVGIKLIVEGLCASGCLPGGEKYTNDSSALFVGGLPPDTTDLELYKIFASFGGLAPKGVCAMKTREGCKGIGFVNFLEESAAHTAIQTLNGCSLPDGTVLKVSVKREGSAKGKDKGDKGKGKGKYKAKDQDAFDANGMGGFAESWT